MDNLFDVLIVIFFIVSILGSLFKKKPQQKQPPPQQGTQTQGKMKSLPKKSDAEILQDLFGIKLPQPFPVPENIKTDKPKQKPGESETWNPENEFKDVVEKPRKTSLENKPANFKSIPDVVYDKIAVKYESLEKGKRRADKTVSTILYEKKGLSARGQEIKQLISKPSTLRDMIIISEILNKPKALRM